jgi:hypothetical protein
MPVERGFNLIFHQPGSLEGNSTVAAKLGYGVSPKGTESTIDAAAIAAGIAGTFNPGESSVEDAMWTCPFTSTLSTN